MSMFWDILDQSRRNILPELAGLVDGFYLAGGTGLALQLGHRESLDFDFFTQSRFDNQELWKKVGETFRGRVLKIQDEKETLTVEIDQGVKVSFFGYKYGLVSPLMDTEYIKIASVKDIGCMKLSAVVSRYLFKDYVDLYWILKRVGLAELLKSNQAKHPDLDTNLVLKSLVYFDDVVPEPILFRNGMEVSFGELKEFLRKAVVEFENPARK